MTQVNHKIHTYPVIYRFPAWAKLSFVVLGGVFVLAAAAGAGWVCLYSGNDELIIRLIVLPVCAGFMALGLSAAISAVRGSLVLYADYLVYTGLLQRTVRKGDILQTRQPRQNYGMFSVLLVLKGVKKHKVRIS